jgi:hypothetical protein
MALSQCQRKAEMSGRLQSDSVPPTVIIGLDLAFFGHRLWERLMVNVGIVLVFWAFYLRFLNRP